MKIVRKSAFETNSSSCHSLAIPKRESRRLDYNQKQIQINLEDFLRKYNRDKATTLKSVEDKLAYVFLSFMDIHKTKATPALVTLKNTKAKKALYSILNNQEAIFEKPEKPYQIFRTVSNKYKIIGDKFLVYSHRLNPDSFVELKDILVDVCSALNASEVVLKQNGLSCSIYDCFDYALDDYFQLDYKLKTSVIESDNTELSGVEYLSISDHLILSPRPYLDKYLDYPIESSALLDRELMVRFITDQKSSIYLATSESTLSISPLNPKLGGRGCDCLQPQGELFHKVLDRYDLIINGGLLTSQDYLDNS